MINVAISYGFSEDNRYRLKTIPTEIQLALYKYKLYKDNRDFILNTLKDNGTKVRAVHLPLDTMYTPHEKILEMISDLFEATGCENFVVHPNNGIDTFLSYVGRWATPKNMCVETFGWRKKKVYRSPLEIIDACKKYGDVFNNVWMVIDTSHLEDVWFDHKIMPYLLRYTKVIHLSNRSKEFGQHLPFNSSKGELNLVSYVRDLKYRYKWSGDIVLEYMPEYHDRLIKNCYYVKKLLE